MQHTVQKMEQNVWVVFVIETMFVTQEEGRECLGCQGRLVPVIVSCSGLCVHASSYLKFRDDEVHMRMVLCMWEPKTIPSPWDRWQFSLVLF